MLPSWPIPILHIFISTEEMLRSLLREISLNMSKQLKEIGRVAKPGQKSAWSAK